MGAPKVYKSTDPNAPVACATPKSLINILDACLVNGYGDLPGAGWTKPFASEDGTGAVYKQGAGGNGMYLKIFGVAELPERWSKGGIGQGFHGAALFESMTDYGNGVGRTPTADTAFAKEMMPVCSRSHYSPNEDSTPCAWLLIADSAFFYFFAWPIETAGSSPRKEAYYHSFFAGTFIPLNTDETGNTLLSSMCSTGGTTALNHLYDARYNKMGHISMFTLKPNTLSSSRLNKNSNTNLFVTRLASGAEGCYPAAMAWGGGPYNAAYDESKPLLISRPYLADGTPADNLRGWLPGFYTSNYEYPFENWTVVEDGAAKFISVSGNDFQYMIDIGPTFRP